MKKSEGIGAFSKSGHKFLTVLRDNVALRSKTIMSSE